MDDFTDWWNHHRVRLQDDKDMPSGHTPSYVMDNPNQFSGINCQIAVPPEAVEILRDYLTEAVGGREKHLAWVSDAFNDAARQAYEAVGSPKLTVFNAWDVFDRMTKVLAQTPGVL